ncbi:hypothetical protein QO005_000709 [Rhizobium paknamense]|uniref:Uncharacterized protein n=1 Tax=Rhizobium paknamense TaxID=1206817 RepID=A0ABU0I826_9HYPH|nr:hypothetical protein [Rhizobium paknamense]
MHMTIARPQQAQLPDHRHRGAFSLTRFAET